VTDTVTQTANDKKIEKVLAPVSVGIQRWELINRCERMAGNEVVGERVRERFKRKEAVRR
jgi:hypothetical protein